MKAETVVCSERECVKLANEVGDCSDSTPTCLDFPGGIPHKIAYEGSFCPFYTNRTIYHGALKKSRRPGI